jgi:drug/metabolite transporter (DMT)-like permease
LLTPTVSSAFLAGARFALAVPVLTVLALFSPVPNFSATHREFHSVLALLLIVLLPDLLGMGLYYAGLRRTPASVATLAELCYPLTALLIGVFVQHAILSFSQGMGLALLLFSVLGLSQRPSVALIDGVAG